MRPSTAKAMKDKMSERKRAAETNQASKKEETQDDFIVGKSMDINPNLPQYKSIKMTSEVKKDRAGFAGESARASKFNRKDSETDITPSSTGLKTAPIKTLHLGLKSDKSKKDTSGNSNM